MTTLAAFAPRSPSPRRSAPLATHAAARALALVGLLGTAACGDDEGGADGAATDTEATGTSTSGTPGDATVDPDDGSTTTGSTSTDSSGTGEDTSTGEPTETLLERVAAAMGGAQALLDLRTLRVESMGDSWITEEGYEPEAAFPTTTFVEVASFDLPQAALRIDLDRSVGTFGVPTPQTFTELVVGEQGWVDGTESLFGFPAGEMLSDRVAAEVRQQRLLHPLLLVRDALQDPSLATEGGSDGTLAQLVIDDPVHPITLWIDEDTALPVRATTLGNDHVWRDVTIEVSFDGWAADAGLSLPQDVVMSVRGLTHRSETRTSIAVDPELSADAFLFPGAPQLPFSPPDADRGARNHHFHQSWANAGLPRDGLDLAIVPVAIPGHDAVTLLTGPAAYNTLIIEREAGVVVVEAPLYAPRCEAILDWIDAEIGKPVEAVVITHHHYDHSACARTFVGAGATLVASAAAEGFWDQVLAAESTIEPDRLATSGVVPELAVVDGSFALGGDPLDVQVFEVTSQHAADITMVLADGVLFTSDLYNPGFPQLLPYGPGDLFGAVQANGLEAQVQAIVGGHGGAVHTLAELQAAAGM
jgi:glyoxylase-like metal-dependent hydrolase (beta-lactamase superfamily II)